MAAMFAKMRVGGGVGSGTGHAKQGSLGSGTSAKDRVKKGDRANLMQVVKSKPHTPDMARKTKSALPSPKVSAAKPAVHSPAAKPHVTPHAGGHGPKGGHKKAGGHGGEHGKPGEILGKIGGAVKEAGGAAVKGAVAGTGSEPIQGSVEKAFKGHKFGDPKDGRHEDR